MPVSVLALAAVASASCVAVQAAGRRPELVPVVERIVVEVHGGTSGLVGRRHRITLLVDDGDPGTDAVRVTADLHEGATSRDFAKLLSWNLRDRGLDCAATETTTARFDPERSEELRLPADHAIAYVLVEVLGDDAWEPEHGHLRVWAGFAPVAEPAKRDAPAAGAEGAKAADAATAPPCATAIEFDLQEFGATMVVVEYSLLAWNPRRADESRGGGGTIHVSADRVGVALDEIRRTVADAGLEVARPALGTLRVSSVAERALLEDAWFTVYEPARVSGSGRSSWSFGFDAR